jgi:hypothetical protein
MLRRWLTPLVCAAALALPVANAAALTRTARAVASKKVITETVTGPTVMCHRWGFMQVQLKVVKTEVTTGAKTSVSIKITGVSWPVFPNHTPRSIYINGQALPLLQQETLQLQAKAATQLENISGASNSTVAWLTSLQAALIKAEKP